MSWKTVVRGCESDTRPTAGCAAVDCVDARVSFRAGSRLASASAASVG